MFAWIKRLVFILSLSGVLGGGAVLLGNAAPGPGHHPAKVACAECHLAGRATTTANAHVLSASQEHLCGRCHEAALTVAHPTGFPPSRPLPVGFPLDWKGDVTCSTCHTVHRGGAGLLRSAARGKALCLGCHEEGFFERMADTGLSITRGGHVAATLEELPVPLDPYSLHCLSCHNDKNQGGPLAIDGRGVLRHGAVSHPIGVVYAEAARRGSFHPEAGLAEEVLLPQGRVSCISCHEGYSEQHGRLVMSNGGSALCLECHDK